MVKYETINKIYKFVRSEDQVMREFAINLLIYFSGADSGVARTIALQELKHSTLNKWKKKIHINISSEEQKALSELTFISVWYSNIVETNERLNKNTQFDHLVFLPLNLLGWQREMFNYLLAQDSAVSLLIGFIEQAMMVAQQHGVNALRDNSDSMGTR